MKTMLMKHMRVFIAIALVLTLAVNADDLAIQSFDGTGKLSFNARDCATNYCVEWSSSPAGPWTNTWASLLNITVPVSGVVTCSVPMCYRVVATPFNYLIVDVSGGTSASSYPVSYLADVPVGGWTDVYKTDKIVFRRIPANTFTMGSPRDELGRNTDETQHQVTLSQDFYIGVFSITQMQWMRVMGTAPSYFNNVAYRNARPVEQVSYNDIRGASAGANWPADNAVDATSFMGNLRAKTGKAFDLPTESQWEYACRAGTTNALNSGYNLISGQQDAHMDAVGRYVFNGGNSYGQSVDTSGATAKVGSYLPNAWGLYDMHGNVGEWCLDWRNAIYPATVTDPKGETSGSDRVTRGGRFADPARFCRSAARSYNEPGSAIKELGFRAVLPPDQW